MSKSNGPKRIRELLAKPGIKTIAEGVETRAQYERLSVEGCEQMQGFYFAAPMSARAFADMLHAGTVTPPK